MGYTDNHNLPPYYAIRHKILRNDNEAKKKF